MNTTHDHPILTVTQLNQQVRHLLEKSFPAILVEGEISNFSQPASGHWYFSLKDNGAQVRCAMFRMQNRSVHFAVKEGTHVIVKAKVALYEERGDFQLIVEKMEEAGFGALQKAFDELKLKLEKEGLFLETHKKKLPFIPKKIGVITSATGAAIRDILQTLKHRFPIAPIIIYPTLVQGNEAAAQIVRMLQLANTRQECDVLILARGGGSLEDLWPFNEEIVARAIYASEIPIISGIGHQTDFTIADFVADVRAPTPTGAATIAAPDHQTLCTQFAKQTRQLQQYVTRQHQQVSQKYDWLYKRLLQTHPLKQITQQKLLLSQLNKKLILLQQHQIKLYQHRLQNNVAKLQRYHPEQLLQFLRARLLQIKNRLSRSMPALLEKRQLHFRQLVQQLHAISPLATLARGYAIAKKENGQLIHEYNDVKKNDMINVTFAKMELICTVQGKKVTK